MKTAYLTIEDLELEAIYYVNEGVKSYSTLDPDEPDEKEIEKIILHGSDIYNIISPAILKSIEEEINNL